MAKQTINIGASPNDGTGTPLRTAFDYCNLNFTELYTATGPSGNNIVVPGSATITGDLTVDTNVLKVDTLNNRVGIGLVSPNRNLSIFGASNSLIHFTTTATGPLNTDGFTFGVETDSSVTLFNSENTPFNFYVNSTLGMTLNSIGLGVGVSPSYKLDVLGVSAATVASGAAFRAIRSSSGDRCLIVPLAAGSGFTIQSQNAAESDFTPIIFSGSTTTFNYRTGVGTVTTGMTLDASGNLLVGVASNPNTARAYFRYDTLTIQPVINSASIVAASTSWNHFVGQSGNGSTVTTNNVFIRGNGDIVNANGVYGTISDLRLKENISDARNYLSDLLKLRVVNYSLKEEASAVANKIGFIAQEVEQVFPKMVDTDKEDTKSIKISVLIPMLVKAIQELTARVQTLEAK